MIQNLSRNMFSLLGGLLFAATSLIATATLFVAVANVFGVIHVFPHLSAVGDGKSSDDISVVFSAAGLLVAIATVGVGFRTLARQHAENRLQRQMETLQRLNDRYDAVIHEVLGAQEQPTEDKMVLLYNKYFATVMTGFRYCQLGLVPREDFVEWTVALVDRFRLRKSLFGASEGPDAVTRRWTNFDRFAETGREAFRDYMRQVGGIADKYASAANSTAIGREAEQIVASVRVARL